MKHCSLSFFPLCGFLLLLVASLASTQSNIGCYIEGDCSGGPLVGFSNEMDSIACHVECQDTPDCRYWSYYQDDGTCLLYSETCNIGNTEGTLSGDVRVEKWVYKAYIGNLL